MSEPNDKLTDQLPEEGELPLWREFWLYLRETGKWWLLPVILSCGALVLLSWFAGTAVAPFIYTLF